MQFIMLGMSTTQAQSSENPYNYLRFCIMKRKEEKKGKILFLLFFIQSSKQEIKNYFYFCNIMILGEFSVLFKEVHYNPQHLNS